MACKIVDAFQMEELPVDKEDDGDKSVPFHTSRSFCRLLIRGLKCCDCCETLVTFTEPPEVHSLVMLRWTAVIKKACLFEDD